MKKKLIIASVVLLASGGTAFWLYTKSPSYSIAQLHRAYEQHDIALFEKHVDSETAISSLIDQIAAIEHEILGIKIKGELIAIFKPMMIKEIRHKIHTVIETGKFDKTGFLSQFSEVGEKIGLFEIWDESVQPENAFDGISFVEKDGKIALMGLDFYHEKYDTSLTLIVKMRNIGDHWQLFDTENMYDYMLAIDHLSRRYDAQAAKDKE